MQPVPAIGLSKTLVENNLLHDIYPYIYGGIGCVVLLLALQVVAVLLLAFLVLRMGVAPPNDAARFIQYVVDG
jgi:hypothetical protein